MKNKIIIISTILLFLVSLGGNAYQRHQFTQAQKQAVSLQKDLSNSKSRLSKTTSELNKANGQVFELNNKIAALNDQIEQAEKKYSELDQLQSNTQSKLGETQRELDSTYCSVTIPIVDAMYTSKNSDLREPITATIEKLYDKSSRQTSYTEIWNNSKDAIFTITLSDRTTSKVAVSWSWSNNYHIRAIYEISGGCYLYFDHTY